MQMPTVRTYTLHLLCFLAVEELKIFIVDFALWLASVLVGKGNLWKLQVFVPVEAGKNYPKLHKQDLRCLM